MLVFAFLAVVSPAHAIFIGDSSGYLWDLDVATNTKTNLGYSGVGSMFDIALDPITDILYGVTGAGNLYSIDKTDGAATYIGYTGVFINGLTFDSSGTLFGSGYTSLFTVNTVTGAASTVGSTGFNSSGDLAFDSSGNLFLSATDSGSDRLVSVDPSTGAGSLIGSIGYSAVYGLNFLEGTLYGFTLGGLTLDIDTGTGAGTLIANNGIYANGADGVGGVAPVPEPATILLLGAGIAGLAGFRKKFRKR